MASFPKFGVNDLRGWWIGSPNFPGNYPVQAHRDLASRDLTEIGKSGLALRVTFHMQDMDSNGDGVIDNWMFPDAVFKSAAQKGVQLLPMLRANTVPTTTQARVNFANATKQIVDRFKAGGSFWTANPTLKQYPADTIELWNEPNLTSYFNGTPQQFGLLLGQCWAKVNQSTPGFKFVSGGLAEVSSNGQSPAQWLASALAVADDEIAAQTNPYFALCGVGFHCYGSPAWSSYQALANLDNFISQLSISTGTPPLTWITEFGWRASPSNVTGQPANTYSDQDLLTRYKAITQELIKKKTGPIFAYAYRMGGTGINLDDGFGWNNTVGTLDGGDSSQAHKGVQRANGDWFSGLSRTII